MPAPIPVKSQCILLFAINFCCYETQQLILWTGTAIWWVTEPHYEHQFKIAKGNRVIPFNVFCRLDNFLAPVMNFIFLAEKGARTISITTLSITTFSIMTLCIKGLYMTLSITMLCISSSVIMLNVAFYLKLCWVSLCSMSLFWVSFCWVTECHFAEFNFVSFCWVSFCGMS